MALKVIRVKVVRNSKLEREVKVMNWLACVHTVYHRVPTCVCVYMPLILTSFRYLLTMSNVHISQALRFSHPSSSEDIVLPVNLAFVNRAINY